MIWKALLTLMRQVFNRAQDEKKNIKVARKLKLESALEAVKAKKSEIKEKHEAATEE